MVNESHHINPPHEKKKEKKYELIQILTIDTVRKMQPVYIEIRLN